MYQDNKSKSTAVANNSGAMESETISKNGRIFTKRASILMIAVWVAACAVIESCDDIPKFICAISSPSIDVCIIMPTGNQSTEYWERDITVPEDIKEVEVVVQFNACEIGEISIKKTGGANLSGYPKKGSFDSAEEHTAKWPVKREKAVGSNEVISYEVSVTDKNSDPRTTSATIKITFQ